MLLNHCKQELSYWDLKYCARFNTFLVCKIDLFSWAMIFSSSMSLFNCKAEQNNIAAGKNEGRHIALLILKHCKIPSIWSSSKLHTIGHSDLCMFDLAFPKWLSVKISFFHSAGEKLPTPTMVPWEVKAFGNQFGSV